MGFRLVVVREEGEEVEREPKESIQKVTEFQFQHVRPCSDFMDMLRRLIICRIIIIIIIIFY